MSAKARIFRHLILNNNNKTREYTDLFIVHRRRNHTASPTTELSTSVDNSFGLLTMPSPAIPTSRLSLNGNSLTLAVSNHANSQMMPRNSLHSSKSNDTIHSHGLATITSNRALQHFNIDEYYVTNDERINVMGKIRTNDPLQHPHIAHTHIN